MVTISYDTKVFTETIKTFMGGMGLWVHFPVRYRNAFTIVSDGDHLCQTRERVSIHFLGLREGRRWRTTVGGREYSQVSVFVVVISTPFLFRSCLTDRGTGPDQIRREPNLWDGRFVLDKSSKDPLKSRFSSKPQLKGFESEEGEKGEVIPYPLWVNGSESKVEHPVSTQEPRSSSKTREVRDTTKERKY